MYWPAAQSLIVASTEPYLLSVVSPALSKRTFLCTWAPWESVAGLSLTTLDLNGAPGRDPLRLARVVWWNSDPSCLPVVRTPWLVFRADEG